MSDYKIANITTGKQLKRAIDFVFEVFGPEEIDVRPEQYYQRWIGRMELYKDLFFYAELDGKIIAVAFAWQQHEQISVGPIATAANFRRRGLARKMMLLQEKAAAARGIRTLALEAALGTEAFYEKMGYTAIVDIDSKFHSLEQLHSLNTKYELKDIFEADESRPFLKELEKLIKTETDEETLELYKKLLSSMKSNHIQLIMPVADRDLVEQYKKTFPGCTAYMYFEKKLPELT